MAPVYIAGYITRNDYQPVNMKLFFCYENMENVPIQLTVENYRFLLTIFTNGYIFVSSFSIQ